MLVFKYVHPDRIDVLENGSIRFTQPGALNDPFDAYPSMEKLEESLKKRQKALVRGMSAELSPMDYVTVMVSIKDRVAAKMAQWRHELRSVVTLLSVSKKRNNLLMWSHYSDSHRGFVIGFDAKHPFFHPERPRAITPLSEVRYSAERPTLPEFDNFAVEDLAERMFFTKSDHWSYEEELRMVAHSNTANSVKEIQGGSNIYLYRVPAECFREVIFGYLMTPIQKERIAQIASNQYPHVELYEARLNANRFDLDIVPYRRGG